MKISIGLRYGMTKGKGIASAFDSDVRKVMRDGLKRIKERALKGRKAVRTGKREKNRFRTKGPR
jgi:hypothetical protein